MLFKRSYRLTSSKTAASIKDTLIGSKFLVHNMEFECTEHNGITRVLPHAEEVEGEKILTLPITRLEFTESGAKTKVKISSHPRKTDVGGPILLLISCIVFFVAGLIMYYIGTEDVELTAKVFIWASGLVGLLFWMKMEFGYFDYVRKIKDTVKKHL